MTAQTAPGPNVAALDSLIAQYRRCIGPTGNGDHTHSKRCKRCKRGSAVAIARGHAVPDALA